jgi:hypothetical protein
VQQALFRLTDRVAAGVLGVGLGLIALPKTVITLSNPVGDIQTKVWYEMSNIGVTNGPSVHKH